MDVLVAAQCDIFEAMKTTLVKYKKDSKARKTPTYFTNRITSLCENWSEFKSNHKEIIKVKVQSKLASHEYFDTGLYSEVEEFVILTKTQLEEDNLVLNPPPKASKQPEEDSRTDKASKVVEKEDIHLPRINIPKFTGEYKDWLSFHDLYSTLVHNNKTISKVAKLHYLKCSLQGEAAQIIRHYNITEANYEPAWDALKRRFDNKRILIKTQLKILFSQPGANTETAANIRKLVDTTEECIQSLKNLAIETENWDVIFTYIVSERLPAETRKRWEQEIGANQEFPSYEILKTFLEGQFRALESLGTNKASPRFVSQKHTFYSSQPYSCVLCSGPHSIRQCSQFSELDHIGRRNIVTQKHLCSNCLSRGHISSDCTSRTSCFKCKHRHHTLLHDDTTIENKTKQYKNDFPSNNKTDQKNSKLETSTNTFHAACHAKTKFQGSGILLATALVKLTSGSGIETTARILIDQGSQATFITSALVQRLKLPTSQTHTTIFGLGNVKAGTVKGNVSLVIASLYNHKQVMVEALVLDKLTSILPSHEIKPMAEWKHLDNLKLADPEYYQPGKIEMILGADVFCKIILNGLRTGPIGTPVAQKTIFGWILSGEIAEKKFEPTYAYSAFYCCTSLNEQLRKFWEIEEIPTINILSPEEKLCEEFYKKTVIRSSDGRYTVRLPFKDINSRPLFGKSRSAALFRFKQIEGQFAKSERLHQEYSKCLQEYLDLRHMIPVSSPEIENMVQDENGFTSYKTNYLPHHAVIKESTTTKLRVVFDASHKTYRGPSLNELLMPGPKIQDNLWWTLLRWRKYRIAITADIEKMYRQIRIHNEDADYQRIVWRNSPDEVVQDYKLQTVTFGTTAAPYLAMRTLHQLADDESTRYPLAAKIMKSDFYVDDLLTGTDTTEQCLALQNELIQLSNSGGFNLRKWTSNKIELLNNIPLKDREFSGVLEFNVSESVKTLGLNWYPKNDKFKYKLSMNLEKDNNITKRKLLSEISKLFDPLGFLAPFIIKMKVLMQVLWIRGTEWDQKIPEDILEIWHKTLDQIKIIESIEIPRWISSISEIIEIHGFCDGSLQAYAAVLYVRVTDRNNVKITLLTAKSKVTPIKQISLPRIELCGALLLARLYAVTKKAMKFKDIKFRAWTDSTIVLAWLRGHPIKYKTFVANRIAEIQEVCSADNWGHVPTNENPADYATRGLLPQEAVNATLWWNGPTWLKKSSEQWPTLPKCDDNNLEARALKVNINIARNLEPSNFDLLIKRYSSIGTLLRVTAYCLRFINLCRKNHSKTSTLSKEELENSLQLWIKRAQRETFHTEIIELKSGKEIKGRLQGLNPFIDGRGILRVGGRLRHAKIPWTEKHPVILPTNHEITTLIINDTHKSTLHGGIQLMNCVLRRKYWIINARNVIKKHIHKCLSCFRQKQEYRKQLMGSLPPPRVQMCKPFQHVGVDYCGPLDIKSSKIKNSKIQKAYISIFVCLVTRAIHIEIVSELTTQAFLAALKRFVGRRGLCTDIYSDNATNFVGAKNVLKEEFNQCLTILHREIVNLVIKDNINWHFIPPASPHFGGLWEAGVKSTKHHLKRILANSKLTFEELTTTTIQIEACLNSRPLCAMSDDPEDLSALTPGHFLIGNALLAVPEPSYLDQREHRLNRWQYMQQLMQSFWKRWHYEYLNTLQQRPKWSTKTKNIEIGNLVLIHEQNLPPCKWALGRVIEVHPGSEGLVRVVTLKTKDTICKRAITKICLLPIEDNYFTETTDQGENKRHDK